MIVEVRARIPNSQKTEPVNSMAETSLIGYVGVIVTVLAVGVALAGLVLKLHHDINRRIDGVESRLSGVESRLVEVEKGQARLEGYMAGVQTRSAQPNA